MSHEVLPVSGRVAKRAGLVTPDVAFGVATTATLVLLLLKDPRSALVGVLIMALCVAGLLVRPLARSGVFWLGLAAVWFVSHRANVLALENHDWLIGYWLLALGLTRYATDPEVALARATRVSIGLCFALATLWKALTPEYLTGEFFHATLLFDPRFAPLSVPLGGLDPGLAARNMALVQDAPLVAEPGAVLAAATTPRLAAVAAGLTAWTVVIEALVAVCFLWPRASRLTRARDAVLVGFMVTTYVVVPVASFAWLLVAMGVAQAERRAVWIWAYAAVFVAVLVRDAFPLSTWLGWLGGL